VERKVAFVTGASRGIGKASAVALARAGFDVVVTARTLREGESDAPGSLETTAAAVRGAGREALPVFLDLLERDSLAAAVRRALDGWGRIDVLVNNAIYVGPETMQHLLDLTPESVERILRANVVAQLALLQLVLPGMLER
jgi:hypothetical protein